MTIASTSRRLAAILAADVVGYSRLMGADEEGTHERFKAHRGLARGAHQTDLWSLAKILYGARWCAKARRGLPTEHAALIARLDTRPTKDDWVRYNAWLESRIAF